MKLQHRTTDDELFLIIEDIARQIDGLDVEYKGKDGTIIEGSIEDFARIIDNIEGRRDEIWEQMADNVSNQKATELDDKRFELRNARSHLQKSLENSDHRWRC